MADTVYAKIVSSSPIMWYKYRIGQIFEIETKPNPIHNGFRRIVNTDINYKLLKNEFKKHGNIAPNDFSIHKDDIEIVSESDFTRNTSFKSLLAKE